MMSSVMCPTCQHKQLLPESEMGKLQNCPSCRSSFVAGKSVSQGRSPFPTPSAPPPPPGAGYNKTMLAGGDPPIKYNCPRCSAPLEAAANEAGTKINCPKCSQRLQVPAALKPAVPPPPAGLNKTMLAKDDLAPPPPIKYNCPNCKRPLEAAAGEAGTKKNCPHCSQRLQVPAAASGLNRTKLASADEPGAWNPSGGPPAAPAGAQGPGGPATPFTPLNVAVGVSVLLLLVVVVPAVIKGGRVADPEAAARQQMELEKLRAEIEQKKNDMERQRSAEAETRRQFDQMNERIRQQEQTRQGEFQQLLRTLSDDREKAKMEEKFKAQQRQLDEERREAERKRQASEEENKRAMAEMKRSLEAAQQKQTVIQQAPPVMYYPPYHPRYYYWW